MSDDRAPIVHDATKPPPPITTTLTWVRMSTGKVPPDDDARLFLLQLVDGSFAIGRRRTLRRVMRPSGAVFVRGTAAPDRAPVIETGFADAASGSVPIDGVRAWAAIEPPP